jgi:thiamine biosynthesis lipoprotein ApbE
MALGVAAASARRPAHGPVTVLSGPTMGTRYAATIGAALDPHARAQALAAVGRELARVDAVMSNWRADSEVEWLNRSPTTSQIAVSRELAEVVAIAEHVSDLSAGAFDITVAPVVRAWGFDGQRLTHLIDPRTARPVRHALASATVVHPSAANADALATAMMGEPDGRHVRERCW